jgi:uncharacterized protein YbjQ (UPF0145 family)
MRFILSVAAALATAAPALAQPTPAQPVFPYDITDRPYEVLGEVKAGVRKATIFSKSSSQDKIYGELWERGKKLGADAVIKAQYGDAHVSAFSWGKTNATGVAIRFLPAGSVPAAASAPAAN